MGQSRVRVIVVGAVHWNLRVDERVSDGTMLVTSFRIDMCVSVHLIKVK